MDTKIVALEPLQLPDGSILVIVDTDDGCYGLGEAGMRSGWRAARGAVEHFAELLIGADSRRIEYLHQLLRRASFFPAAGPVAAAAAAIDIALWDIRGKQLGVPVHELFGGASRDHVTCYTHLRAPSPDALLDEARESVAAGWRHLRFPARDPAEGDRFDQRAALRHTIEITRRLREAVGADVELLLDLHTRFDAAQAVVLCKELEPLRPFFVEDPVRSEDPHAYRMLRERTAVPLAAGEQYTNAWQFRPLLEGELVDFARPDVANLGLTEARKVAALAEVHHINLVTHNPLGPVTTAASLQLNLAVPNVALAEQTQPVPEPPAPFTLAPSVTAGQVVPAAAPGLGVDLDRRLARRLATDQLALRHPVWHRPDGSFTNW